MEQNKTSKFDIDIEIKDLLWEFLRRWRMIVVLALVCGIGLTAYQYRIDMNKTDVVTVKKTQEELEKAMATQDLDEVTAAVALKRQLDEKSAYMEESVLMGINPYEENAVIMQYYVKADEQTAASSAEAYISYVENGHLAQAVAESGAYELTPAYMAELISIVREEGNVYINAKDAKESIKLSLQGSDASYSFDVKVVGKTMEEAEALASDVKAALQTYSSSVASAAGSHLLQLLEETSSVMVDQGLAELQNWNATSIKTISNNLDSMKNEMTSDQITLYTYRTTVVETNTAAATTAPAVKTVSISLKHAIIGVIVGAVLACGLIFACYLFAAALRSAEEVKTLYRVKVLGCVDDTAFQKKKVFGFVDGLIVKLQNIRKKKLSFEQEVQMICANIALDCRKNDRTEVVLTGSVMEKLPQEVVKAVIGKCEEKNIHVAVVNAINYDAEALEAAAKIGSVVFVEKKRVSLYDELQKEIALCKENDINVLGMVVLGA
ncbi:MAG: hypothetical protein IJZ23_09090 [Roseburia sp.]|nr:hypothetical protein [Roseburia sp.]